MAEELKTSTKGRKPKAKVESTETVNTTVNQDMNEMLLKMQAQIETLQKQLEVSNAQVQSADKEKSDLQQLVEVLQNSNKENETKQLPKKVKVMSLITNKYNLTTERDGQGKQFTFEDFGDIVTMKTSELEDILSIQSYREQAEKGYFYILDRDIVEDQELSDSYSIISDKETLNRVMNLENDECVEIFCGLSKELQDSLGTRMAENLLSGRKLDRNRIADISMRTDIDIEKMANEFKKIKKN